MNSTQIQIVRALIERKEEYLKHNLRDVATIYCEAAEFVASLQINESGTTESRATGDGPTQANENQQLGGHHGC